MSIDLQQPFRAYYCASVKEFLAVSKNDIYAALVRSQKDLGVTYQQDNSWWREIDVLRGALDNYRDGYVAIEYTIPRMGKRIDAVLIVRNRVILLEFKCEKDGNQYARSAKDQVLDYALDLHNFHAGSDKITLFPVLVATGAESLYENIQIRDNVAEVLCANAVNLSEVIGRIIAYRIDDAVDPISWFNAQYRPTPTIIEAAQAMYAGHKVADISRSEGDVNDILITTAEIDKIIEKCKKNHEKAICFVTGVPGAGKTLVGLNLANRRHNFKDDSHAVYLSGNYPLVTVLQEALTRDQYERSKVKTLGEEDLKVSEPGSSVSKGQIKRQTKSFIQMIHTFRDESVGNNVAPIDRIAIFDESQRAWTKTKLSKFMAEKKNQFSFSMSEPECLIEYMNRHEDWACIVCLVGGGQEINDGEAGIEEWFKALNYRFREWHVYYSDKMTGDEYLGTTSVQSVLRDMQHPPVAVENLHLTTSKRSFRSEQISNFAKEIIDGDVTIARGLYQTIQANYPFVVTRDLQKAKKWILEKARGTERYGIIASSKAKRLRADGINIDSSIKPEKWFLEGSDNVDSSYFMELAATEFDIQGLEIDWVVLAWEGDYRYDGDRFTYNQFKGTKWMKVNDEFAKRYLKNTYRVLLTRARQGMIIYVPKGNLEDATRKPEFYDGTYEYLKSIGIKEI